MKMQDMNLQDKTNIVWK